AVTDTLPTGVTFVSARSGCANGSGTVTCTVGALANGANRSEESRVGAANNGGTITNTANGAGQQGDPRVGNKPASAATTVNGSADLSITKTAPATVGAGQQFTYTLSVHNGGPSDATGVSVTDPLPTGVTFVSASTGCTNASGTVTCTVGALANGANATATIVVTAPNNATPLTNTATVAGSPTDPNTANNTASATTTVTASADLSITKTAPTSVTVGQQFTYTLSVHNGGPSDATGVNV